MSNHNYSRRSSHAQPRARGRRRLSIGALAAIDILGAGVLLVIYALFHHVIQFESATPPQVLPTPTVVMQATPEPTPTSAAPDDGTPEPVATPRPGVWGDKFAEKFTDGEVISDENGYRSQNICVERKTLDQHDSRIHVADIYISDLKYLRAAYADGEYKNGATAFVDKMAQDNNAIVAISGDHYSMRREGVVVRNGELARDARLNDVCILHYDGTMETLRDQDFDLEKLKTEGAYQLWSFGPRLMENGLPRTEFTAAELPGINPRSGIGYVEPGHYVFIMVDGSRNNQGYRGVSLSEFAQLFADQGCVVAYNFDGGASAAMAWGDELISAPYNRMVGDAVYIGEVEE